ncbi:ascorbate-dependent monooxygenase [Tundrisphaera lichenicola]|uniref:ascorbate-dependent monooxygenase n=1 Tax=Tundrisphaera lichenicola TaxID=2029860 RepID=UPI003EC0502E
MRRGIGFGVTLSVLIGFSPANGEVPTYHGQVVAILQKHCQDCHRPGQVAPFSLLTFDQARKRGADILQQAEDRRMPPWPASTAYGGPFLDQRILPDADLDTLRSWVAAGCPEGDPKDAPPAREFSSDWPLGPPDLILTMPEPYELEAEGDDEFRVFVLKTALPSERWIQAVDFRPGNRKVVHHILAGVEREHRGRELDAGDEKPGYSSVGGFGDGVRTRGFLPIWTPGSRPRYSPENSGYLLPSGADVLVQMHYHKSGKVETDATEVGLYFSEKPLPNELKTGFIFPEISTLQGIALGAKARAAQAAGKRLTLDETLHDILVIPAGVKNYEVRGSNRKGMGKPIDRDIILTSVMPHMHWLGKDFEFTAVLPDEKATRIPLIKIERWDFNWQGTYGLVEPIKLPKGTHFETLAHFDNSDSNPSNQNHPPKTVHWGEQTNDEMMIGIFEFIVDEPNQVKP